MQSNGIVNGHWEPTERHSRVLELIRLALAKLAQTGSPETSEKLEPDSAQERRQSERPAAAE
jgi:hypothetical protein